MENNTTTAGASKRTATEAFPDDDTTAGPQKRQRGRPRGSKNRRNDNGFREDPRRSMRLRGQGAQHLGVLNSSVTKHLKLVPHSCLEHT